MTMRKDQLSTEDRGRILPFSPRAGRGKATWNRPPPIADVENYVRPREDDYPHRMKTNLAAFLVLALLVVCGWWLADAIAQMRKNQDCVLSGRRNCNPIEVPASRR